MNTCLGEADIQRLHRGPIAPDEKDRLLAHLRDCGTCAERYDAYLEAHNGVLHGIRDAKNAGDFASSGRPMAAGGGGSDRPARPGGAAAGGASSPPGRGGLRIPGYELIERIGKGGMGIVYKARQITLDRIVALKILIVDDPTNEHWLNRFEREAKAAAKLHHSNIVPVYDFGKVQASDEFGEVSEVYYYAMELIEGEPLNKHIDRLAPTLAGTTIGAGEAIDEPAGEVRAAANADRPLSSPPAKPDAARRETPDDSTGTAYYRKVARWMADAAEALHYAHSQSVIHRDIKPHNMMLARDGRIMILDFGLAKTEGHSMTQRGDALGTPAYMSPEQVMAKQISIDHRTDIYSLGATMYHLLTLQPPFQGTQEQIFRKVIFSDPRPPRKIASGVPDDLDLICLKMMEKDPDDRYVTAESAAEDLRRFTDGLPPQATRPSFTTRIRKFAKRRPAACLAVLLAVMAMTTGAFAYQKVNEANQQRCEQLINEGIAAHGENARDFAEAEKKFREAIELCPDSARAWGNFARMKHDQWKLERRPQLLSDAKQFIMKALRIEPASSGFKNILGLVARDSGDHETAIRLFQEAIAIDPTDYPPRTNLASIYVRQQRFAEAEEELRQAVALADAAPIQDDALGQHRFMARLNLVACQICSNVDSARETLDGLGATAAKNAPMTNLLAATALLKQGRFAEARDHAASATFGIRPGTPHAPRILRVFALAQLRTGAFSEAAETARHALTGEAINSRTPASGLAQGMAATTTASGQMAGWSPLFPDDVVRLHLIRSIALAHLKRQDEATVELEQARKTLPGDLQPNAIRVQKEVNGYVWFDCDDEILGLKREAEETLGLTAEPTVTRSRP